MATKRSLALAAEAGKVEFWTHSASAGCMLYLHGASGTDYYYIHLNNDLTPKNDNRGKCVAGTAYAKGLKDGAKVQAGQPVGYVGDSGDANGIHAHLHFELHPGRGAATDPYPWLQRATHLLFSAPRGMPFTLELRGTVVSVTDDAVQLKLADGQRLADAPAPDAADAPPARDRARRRDGAAASRRSGRPARPPISPRRSPSSRSASGRRPHRRR